MVMVGQQRRLSEPLRWTRAGRAAVIAAALALVAGICAVAVIGLTQTPSKRVGCVEVTFASSLGAATLDACGRRARTICAEPQANPGAAAHGALREACRRAGLAYGAAASNHA